MEIISMVKPKAESLERSLQSSFWGQECSKRSSRKPCLSSTRDISCSSARIPRRNIELQNQYKLHLSDLPRDSRLSQAFRNPNSRKVNVLEAIEDEYNGIIVDPDRLPKTPSLFASALRTSLFLWRLMGKKGVWLKLPIELSDLVSVAVKEGFKYHHAEEDYVMMTSWISHEPNMLPKNASHHVGVGGFVINEKNEVLVVQEKHCSPALSGLWKLPTGFVLEGEEIFEGAIREVKEETGVDTEFQEIVSFRHEQGVAFEKSDLFFICMMKPLTTTIEIDNLEVQAAKWMPLVEFVEQPSIQGDHLFNTITDICIKRLRKGYCGFSANHLFSNFEEKSSCLYYNFLDTHECIS